MSEPYAPLPPTRTLAQLEDTHDLEPEAAMRRVILWCVEAYFGHLGGGLEGRAD